MESSSWSAGLPPKSRRKRLLKYLSFLPKTLYRDLKDDEVRVAVLHPSRVFTAPVNVTLRTVKLSTRSRYKALSYVWGDPSMTSEIFVDGLKFKATTNLAAALQHIRHKHLDEVLWVDALCINQLDVYERNHQVLAMQTIYRGAEEVIAWLGSSSDDSDEAMSLLRRWGAALKRAGIRRLAQAYRQRDWLHVKDNAEGLIDDIERPFCERSWNALTMLFQRPYWRRLWIFQEFVLASNVIVMCGNQRNEASDFLTEIVVLYWERFFPSQRPADRAGFEMVQSCRRTEREERSFIGSLLEWRDAFPYKTTVIMESNESGHDTLFDLLWPNLSRECADPRDYIFAMASFCEESVSPIVIDYSLSEQETFKAFSQTCILKCYFQILCFTGTGYTEEGEFPVHHPTWVPVWSGPGQERMSAQLKLPDPLAYRHFHAGGVNRVGRRPNIGSHPSTIVIPGVICDTVEEMLEGWSGWEKPGDTRWQDLLFEGHHDTTYVTGIPLLQAYFHTLLTDMDGWEQRLGRLYQSQEESRTIGSALYGGLVLNFLTQHCVRKRHAFPVNEYDGSDDYDGSDVSDELSQIQRPDEHNEPNKYDELMFRITKEMDVLSLGLGHFFLEGQEPSIERWAEWVHDSLKQQELFRIRRLKGATGKCFFTTTQGYMGTGPPYAKKGDVICIFQGAKVPFLLRKDIRGYRLVGEAFVLGMMDGEKADGFEEVVLV